jgi:NAD(P)-dependent dehydrogenase (short-subunit alcohol dehydrogenase family)
MTNLTTNTQATTTTDAITNVPAGAGAPVAVITGASRGLGRALAKALAGAGWQLVIDARGAEELAESAAELTRLARPGRAVIALPGDVVDDAHRVELAETAARLGGATLLVHNASALGGSPLPSLASIPQAALLDTFEVNVLAPTVLTQLLLPQLRAAAAAGAPAAVLAISSDAAVEAYEGWGAYGASKAALDQVAAVLAVEEPALRVYAVDPGDLRTRMHQDAFPGEDISDRPLPETVVPAFLWLLAERPPSGRLRAADLLPAVTR